MVCSEDSEDFPDGQGRYYGTGQYGLQAMVTNSDTYSSNGAQHHEAEQGSTS